MAMRHRRSPRLWSTQPIRRPCARLWQRLRMHTGGTPPSCMRLVLFPGEG